MRIGIFSLASVFVATLLVGQPSFTSAQTETPAKPGQGDKPGPPPKFAVMGQELIKGLKTSPGCLGVETAFTMSGKSVIFAWFKDKKACLDWYHSPTHQKMVKDYMPDYKAGKPLRDVPDDCGPILAIASLTPGKEAKFKELSLPVSQIAIELYTPLKGGLSLGGTFAPPGVEVPKSKVEPKKK